ncbi:hypothetical protein [Desulfosarcina sp.]
MIKSFLIEYYALIAPDIDITTHLLVYKTAWAKDQRCFNLGLGVSMAK